MILLDTNIAIALLNGDPARVRERFDAAIATGESIGLSTIVHHELMYGAAFSARRRENEAKIALLIAGAGLFLAPFETADAAEAGDVRAHLKRLGSPIGPYDVLIAGQARRLGALLITSNRAEFERVPGLKLADWAS